MQKVKVEREKVYAANRTEWRRWLSKNHTQTEGVWLVYFKKESGKSRVSYDEAVEEALCFGWIDSVVNKLDTESFMQLFSPRKARSTWSRLNKTRVERLIQEGLMTEAGLKKIELAKGNGMWDSLNEVEKLTVPEDLRIALGKYKEAEKHFNAFSPSSKRALLWWVHSAKRPETRTKRVEETARQAAKNVKANFPLT